MPTSVTWVRVLLYAMAALSVLLLVAVVWAGFTAAETGAAAGPPLLLGIIGLILAIRIGPGRRLVRIGIIAVQALWLLAGLGGIGQGDPTGLVMLVVAIAVLVVANSRAARSYFAAGAQEKPDHLPS